MEHRKMFIISVVGSVVATAVTGLMRNASSGLVGASWYGYPLAWVTKRVLAPQYNPWFVQPWGLFVDLLFWFVVIGLVLFLWKGPQAEKQRQRTKRRR